MNISVREKDLGASTGGIVRGGETLKQHRDRLMAATKRTGSYAGLEKMELRDSQPILYPRARPPAGDRRKSGAQTQALGRSRGGLTTNFHMVCDSWVDRCASCSPPVSDNLTVKAVQRGFQAEAVLADRAYDNTDLRQAIAEMDAQAVIPSTHSRKVPILHNQSIYKERNRIEHCASTSSSTSAASQRATTFGKSTTWASSILPPSCSGCGECGFVLVTPRTRC
ncbi:hypothetical protein [Ancylobacter moscoviensis]